MAMMGLVEAGMEVVDGIHAGQSQGFGHMSGDARALPGCEVILRSHHRPGAQLWVGSSQNWSVFLKNP